MDTKVLNKVEEDQYKKRPEVRVGDTVRLHLKIKEGDRERIQVFEGVVISIKGSGLSKNLVVRKISYGIGVEKIVPLHSDVLEKIEVIKRGTVRKSKLYYLRKRVGKRALKVGMAKDIYLTDEEVEEIIKEDLKKAKEEGVQEEENEVENEESEEVEEKKELNKEEKQE
jgi:large subunit ribosomal protein L19